MRIYSIFNSIDGEVSLYHQGRFSTFIRLAGCNLRCRYCDTEYALREDSGEEMDLPSIVRKVVDIGCNKVTITGGEPLMQRNELHELIRLLSIIKYKITVETNGSFSTENCPAVGWIMDYKLPSAGTHAWAKMDDENFMFLNRGDFVKFIIGHRGDYTVAVEKMRELKRFGCKARFAYSIHGTETSYNQLIDWLKSDKEYDTIINVQLHKLIGLREKK